MDTQTLMVLRHLQSGRTITNLEATNLYGATRLGSIIFRLRSKYKISTIMTDGVDRYGRKTRYGVYKYIGEKE